ncbi:MAG: ABC transporter permease subunit [Bacteroidota bacterium]|nr:ABC transporter permease subunit [Bacteroidota bacterium]
MITLYKKELSVFFSTIIGPLIIGLFLLINSLVLWSNISQFNILDNAYASIDSFFTIAPLLFLLFIPAISMRTFSEEYNIGTIESLITKPITTNQIIASKFLAILTLVTASIVPTFLYVITIYFLGETPGNLDLAGIIGSYIGLLMLSSIFVSIGVFASSISNNQVISFILGIIISVIFYFGFDLLSKIQILESIAVTLQKIGISYHYNIISKGLLLVSDIIYFLSISFLFLKLSEIVILSKK